MALEIKGITRKFIFEKNTLEDPNPALSPDEVRKYYVAQYPALTTANIDGPEVSDGVVKYTFGKIIGTKG